MERASKMPSSYLYDH
ncbi:protein YadX [Shigella flexneri]